MEEASSVLHIKQEEFCDEEENSPAGANECEEPMEATDEFVVESDTKVGIKQESIVCAGKKPKKSAEKRPKKMYQHSKQHGLSDYNKKQIFRKWQESNFSEEGFERAVKKFKVDPEKAKAFFQQQIDDAQGHVHEEVDSKQFRNAKQWLKRLEQLKLDRDGNNESATIFGAMAHLKSIPTPEEMGGLCLRTCYQYIANAALGKPPPEMNEVTTAFLLNQYKTMRSTCETEDATEAISIIKARLQDAYAPDPANKVKRSLDPFSLDDTM